jgi:hypothetical protein
VLQENCTEEQEVEEIKEVEEINALSSHFRSGVWVAADGGREARNEPKAQRAAC